MQVREEADENAMRVRRADQKSRLLSLRMSKLEVELANAQNVAAEDEEQKAMVFKSVMDEQEARIRELQLRMQTQAEKAALSRLADRKDIAELIASGVRDYLRRFSLRPHTRVA